MPEKQTLAEDQKAIDVFVGEGAPDVGIEDNDMKKTESEIPNNVIGSKDKPFTSLGDIVTIIQNTHYILDKEGASAAYFSFRNEKYRLDRDLSIYSADSNKTIEPHISDLFKEAVLEIRTKRKRS